MFENINYLPGQKKKAQATPQQRALTQLTTSLNNISDSGGVYPELTKVMLGFESAVSETDLEGGIGQDLNSAVYEYANTAVGLMDDVNASVESKKVGLFDLNGAAIEGGHEHFNAEAAMIAAAASGDAVTYHRAATAPLQPMEGFESVDPIVSGAGGTVPVLDSVVPSLESFDTSALDNYKSMTIAFNGGGARQDAFGELFYPTKVCPGDQTGLGLEVSPTMVMKDFEHGNDGKPADFNRVRLLDAVRDDSILDYPVTKLVPHRQPGQNDAYFVPAAEADLDPENIGGEEVTTGWLVAGKPMDLIGLTNHPGLLGNAILNTTDAIDPPMNVGRVLLKLSNSDGSVTELFAFEANGMAGSRFYTPPEGRNRDQYLNWSINNGFVFNKDTKMVDGGDSTLLAGVKTNELNVTLTGLISGTLNLETGNAQVGSSGLHIDKITDKDGKPALAADADPIRNAVASISVRGWTPDGSRSNLNLRQRGLLLSYEADRYRYAAVLQAPLSVLVPPSRRDGDSGHVQALTSAARVRNSNNAVISLFNYADFLKRHQLDNGEIVGLGGPGAKVLHPVYIEEEVDVKARTQTISSHERELDVTAILINKIRDLGIELIQRSGYMTTVEHSSMGSNAMPVMAIGTDPITQRYMTIKGDPRTAGLMLDAQIATTINSRMRNHDTDTATVFISFTRPGMQSQGIDVLSCGFHLWTPELVSITTLPRNGATSREITVQPRSAHFNVLPVLAKLTVKNLKLAATSA